jgi:hypothetical protein
MQIRYTNHAISRMAQRGISQEKVEICLKNYQERYPDSKGYSQYAYKYDDGTLIRVVVKEIASDDWLIITVKN